MASPFRTEIESLRAENARLRAKLEASAAARARRARAARGFRYPTIAVGLVALDYATVVMLRPWLNGASDARFWAGLAVVVGIAVAAAACALRYKSH